MLYAISDKSFWLSNAKKKLNVPMDTTPKSGLIVFFSSRILKEFLNSYVEPKVFYQSGFFLKQSFLLSKRFYTKKLELSKNVKNRIYFKVVLYIVNLFVIVTQCVCVFDKKEK